MTKSTLRLAQEALIAAQEASPRYASRFSRRDFTLHQLFAILVLRKFLKTDYRGIVAMLVEWSDLRETLKLNKTPGRTTLWYAEQKLIKKGLLIDSCPHVSFEPRHSG